MIVRGLCRGGWLFEVVGGRRLRRDMGLRCTDLLLKSCCRFSSCWEGAMGVHMSTRVESKGSGRGNFQGVLPRARVAML